MPIADLEDMYQISLREHAKEWERLKNKMTAIDRWDVFGPTYPCMPRERIGSVTDGGKWCAAVVHPPHPPRRTFHPSPCVAKAGLHWPLGKSGLLAASQRRRQAGSFAASCAVAGCDFSEVSISIASTGVV